MSHVKNISDSAIMELQNDFLKDFKYDKLYCSYSIHSTININELFIIGNYFNQKNNITKTPILFAHWKKQSIVKKLIDKLENNYDLMKDKILYKKLKFTPRTWAHPELAKNMAKYISSEFYDLIVDWLDVHVQNFDTYYSKYKNSITS